MKSKTSLLDKIILNAYNFYWTSQEQADSARQRIEHVLTLLAKYGAEPPARILDTACGDGFYTLALAQAGFRTLGVDFVPLLLDRAQAKATALHLNAEFEKMNLDGELWFDRHEFDHVVCLLALHQLGKPTATLSELKRVLKPGGLLLITLWTDQRHYPEEFAAPPASAAELPRKAGAKVRVKDLGGRAFKAAYTMGEKRNPPQFWSAAALQTLLEQQGFEVLEIGGQPLMSAVARCK